MSSVLIEKVLEDFRKLYEDRFGKCFRTEIRDTGVFICGIHQSRIWENPEAECPELEDLSGLIEDAFEGSMDRSGTVPKPPSIPAIPPKRADPYDGTRWPTSTPPAPRLNPSGKSIRDEMLDWLDNQEPTRDSYNVPI